MKFNGFNGTDIIQVPTPKNPPMMLLQPNEFGEMELVAFDDTADLGYASDYDITTLLENGIDPRFVGNTKPTGSMLDAYSGLEAFQPATNINETNE
ncbi:hypothetical protein [Capybara microvirus Cap3_SP_383]|nr:hypothetical protein [Capybara microvirus Cap3_SP_383]